MDDMTQPIQGGDAECKVTEWPLKQGEGAQHLVCDSAGSRTYVHNISRFPIPNQAQPCEEW